MSHRKRQSQEELEQRRQEAEARKAAIVDRKASKTRKLLANQGHEDRSVKPDLDLRWPQYYDITPILRKHRIPYRLYGNALDMLSPQSTESLSLAQAWAIYDEWLALQRQLLGDPPYPPVNS